MQAPALYPSLDLQQTTSSNRLVGLWRLISGFRLVYLGAMMALALAAASKTFTFLLLRDFADTVLGVEPAANVRPLYHFALAFIGLALVQGIFTFLSGKLAARSAEGVILRLRNYLFDHIQYLSLTYHDRTQTGELIQRSTSDVDAVRRFLATEAIEAGRILAMFVINFAALLFLNVKLGLLSVIFMPIVVVMSVLFFRRIAAIYDDYQSQEAVLSTTLQENLTGVRVVRAFARQDFEIDKFEQENRQKYRLGKRLLFMHSLYWPASDIICAAQMLGIFFLGAIMAINGDITVGTYLAVSSLVIWLIWPMRNLGRLIVHASSALVSYRRVADVLDEARERLDVGRPIPSGSLRGEVVFKHVFFEYAPGAAALRDVSFRAEPGQMIALLGPTGSGKTSLVNLLPRFYEHSRGSITLDGVDLKEYAVRDLRQQIGIVEQEPFLFSRTIRENITHGVDRPVSDAEVEAVARAAAIHDVIMTFPHGYDTLVGEKGVTLSGGQKQRLAIARALLKDPRILILDDSTSSVDMETESLIQAALEKLMSGRTTFVIAHRLQTIMRADKILVLNEGRVVQQGTHEQLVRQPGLYQDIYYLQSRIETEIEQEATGVKLRV